MMRILLSIGCNIYNALPNLTGAEEDAQRIWTHLTLTGTGQYDSGSSRLILSPTHDEVRRTLTGLTRTSSDLDVLTIFFAGHGGVKAGSYYFCVSDSDPSSLATTALSLTTLLAVISEIQPQQVNLIIDACQAGGGMFDFPAVLKRGALGENESTGISVFAACRSNESASEDASGGIATTELLRFLHGEKVIQTTRPYLDLVELGRAVSVEVSRREPSQTPVTWGINLHGESLFAANPGYAGTAVASGGDIVRPYAGTVAETFGPELWHVHQQVSIEVQSHQVIPLLRKVADHLSTIGHAPATFLRGLSTSLRSAANDSEDLFGEAQVIDCFLSVLLGRESEAGTRELVADLLSERCNLYPSLAKRLDELVNERFGFVSNRHPLADLFFLPVRISSILGWIGSHLLITDVLGRRSDTEARHAQEIASRIFQGYGNSTIAISDVQAPAIYSFSSACWTMGWIELAEEFLGRMFFSIVSSKGVVARLGLTSSQIFRYLTERASGSEQVYPRLIANPSNLTSTLLLLGVQFNLDEAWDPDLSVLDHRSCNYFIPKSYASFGEVRIEAGTNHGVDIGHGIWTLSDLRSFLSSRQTEVIDAIVDLTGHQLASAVACSLAMPDRVPLFVDRLVAPHLK